MSAGRDITSPAELPARMRAKITEELCPVAGLDGFCWTWTGCVQSKGYGCWNYDGRRHLTHRVSYRLLVGEIPAGLEIDHLCANRLCCNPAHLEAVTSEVNSRRSHTATKTLCVNGHQLAGENLIIKRRANGRTIRNCRTCQLCMSWTFWLASAVMRVVVMVSVSCLWAWRAW